ncbi:hypothetical protein EON80_14130 [bacterium]|nr:MAG: hypothetical protein EON80_14130 [bacterium]
MMPRSLLPRSPIARAAFVLIPLVLLLVSARLASWRPREVKEGGWSEYLAFSDDGQTLAICGFPSGETTSLRMRRFPDGALLEAVPPSQLNSSNVQSVLWAPHPQPLISVGSGVSEWGPTGAKKLFDLAYVSEMALSPQDRWLVAAGSALGGLGSEIVLWNVQSRRPEYRLRSDLNFVQVAISRQVVCVTGYQLDKRGANRTGLIRLYSLPTSRLTRQFSVPHFIINDVALSPTDPKILALSDNHGLNLIDTHNGRSLAFFPYQGQVGSLGKLAFSPDGSLLACSVATSSGGPASNILLFEVSVGAKVSLRQIRTLVGHKAWASTLTFSPDGKTLASGGYDKVLRFWRVR